ncbi:hypothetical protein ACF3MZ_23400 [Paenibacillaceae bacterium WGS1546]|uniref:hypothetical protein n=1 Tax=Cohnella sp. WGS1546 TaxID=3366810 RepID=UPI00372D70F2
MKDHDKKLSTNYEKGQQLIENFVEHAIVNLNAMLDGPRRGAPPDKERLVSEFKKFQHVNAALAAIPNEQIDIRFNFEFQNIRIILRTLEYEIERVIKKLYVELEIANVNEAFHRIEIDKRILFILDHIMKFSNHPELQRIRNELHKSTAEERDPIA